jgi:hypothetical protein
MSDASSNQGAPTTKKKDKKLSNKNAQKLASAYNAWRNSYGGEADSSAMVTIEGKIQGNPTVMKIPDPDNTFRFSFCFNETCKFAYTPPPKLRYCSKCPKGLRAQYCSVDCQRYEWPFHKPYCRLKTIEERLALDKAYLAI